MLGQVRPPSLWIAVDKADDVDPVLRVLHELASDQLADLSGADDQGVLLVRSSPLAGLPGECPRERKNDDASAQNVINA